MAQYNEVYFNWLKDNEKKLLRGLEELYPSFLQLNRQTDVLFKKFLVATANEAADKEELREQTIILERQLADEVRRLTPFAKSFGIKQHNVAFGHIRRCLQG